MTYTKKSPFYRAVNGEWRDKETTRAEILSISNYNVDFKKIREDIKNQTIVRGVFTNNDTAWNIQISRNGLEDSVKYGFKHKDTTVYNMLYQLPKLVENSILLDSFISERNNSNKAYNTAFMHKLYGVCRVDDKPYLAKITVEEFANGQSGTLMRMYNFQDIKIEPIRLIEFTEEQLARSVLKGSNISISDLFKVVKHYDNDFYINHSEQKSQELFSVLGLKSSQGLNILDPNVIIHQSRNIVKGMQKENNAEQLSFFENSTLEDTEVEIPFAVGDEIDYGERHYTISKIDKEKNTVTLLDYNTGWYPISHDEDLSMVIAEFEAVREKEIAGFVNIT